MRQPTPRRRDPQARHAQVLTTATQLIATAGLERLTFDRLSRLTRIPPSTIQRQFPGTQILLQEICERHLDELVAAVEEADRPGAATRRRLDRMALALLRAAAARAQAHQVLAIGMTRLPTALLVDIERKRSWLVTLFAVALEAVLPRLHGHRTLADTASGDLVALLDGHGRHRGRPRLRREAYVRFAVGSILEGARALVPPVISSARNRSPK